MFSSVRSDKIGRRRVLTLGAATGLAALTSACTKVSMIAKSDSGSRPNFLFLSIDDLNDWVGVLGTNANVKTPNIDALAGRGMLFTNAHAQAPICAPSRASLMSGLHPHQTGLYGQISDDKLRGAVRAVSPTLFLTEYLKKNGYYTAGRGKLFHKGAPEGTFDEFFREGDFGPKPPQRLKWESNRTHTDWGPFPDTDAEMIDYQTAQWGAAWLQKTHDNPFFLGLGMIRPHVPWHAPQKWFDMYPLEDIELPPWLETDMDDIPLGGKTLTAVPQMPTLEWAIENNEWRPILQAYLASISFVDHCVGIAVDALRASTYAENTYIILFSDHGYHLGEKSRFAKMSLWERSTRVPLIISGPGVEVGKTNATVGLVDLYPTILDLAGLPENLENSGQSLMPLLQWNASEQRSITTEYGKDNFAVVNENYRYIRYANGDEEFYDLRNDPNEWTNVANDTKFAAVKKRLAREIPSKTRNSIEVKPGASTIKQK
ncbi:MAG: sulfatase [Hyphomonadaceae bacterium]|nr:sulfatase [Hyphomonadaceae bacterium]